LGPLTRTRAYVAEALSGTGEGLELDGGFGLVLEVELELVQDGFALSRAMRGARPEVSVKLSLSLTRAEGSRVVISWISRWPVRRRARVGGFWRRRPVMLNRLGRGGRFWPGALLPVKRIPAGVGLAQWRTSMVALEARRHWADQAAWSQAKQECRDEGKTGQSMTMDHCVSKPVARSKETREGRAAAMDALMATLIYITGGWLNRRMVLPANSVGPFAVTVEDLPKTPAVAHMPPGKAGEGLPR